jgi:hypothetical protein
MTMTDYFTTAQIKTLVIGVTVLGVLGIMYATGHGSTARTLLLLAVYMTPALIAHRAHTANREAVTVVNLLLGWTFIGWVIALAMAIKRQTSQ